MDSPTNRRVSEPGLTALTHRGFGRRDNVAAHAVAVSEPLAGQLARLDTRQAGR